jgi:outer membrane protein assembly factor BamB
VEEGEGIALKAIAVDATTGKIDWEKEIVRGSVTKIHNKNSHASATPIAEGDRVYVHFGHQGTAALDRSGKIIWVNTNLYYSPVHGNGGSPVLTETSLIFSADGGSEPFVVALKKSDGSVLWKVPRNTDATRTFSFSTPLIVKENGKAVLLSPGSNMLGAYDPATGEELWRVRYDGYSVVPRPVFDSGRVFIGTGYDRPSVLAINVGGKGDVTTNNVVWKLTRGAPNTPSMLLIGKELYMVSDAGIASCVDAATGEVHWQERLGGNFSASPVYAAGRIYFQNEEGEGKIIMPGKEFKVVSTNNVGERTLLML